MNIENEHSTEAPSTISRRQVLKKAGWFFPTIAAVSLINTASAMSGNYEDQWNDDGWDDGGKDKGGKGKDGKDKGGKGKGGGGKGKGGKGKGGKHH